MKREVTLEEISDGKLYDLNDMVRADCQDCRGCSACCRGMGSSIVLDPFDVHNLCLNLGLTFEELLDGRAELNAVDGVILPSLTMSGTEQSCVFLNSQGRCSIHPFRPGICRLFPLGRYYENESYRYFLQIHECKNNSRSKIKVRKWLDIPDIKKYESFICRFHYFLLKLQSFAAECGDMELVKGMNLYVLNHFYLTPFDRQADFYGEIERRILKAEEELGV